MMKNKTELAMLANLLGISKDQIGQAAVPAAQVASAAIPGVNDLGDVENAFSGALSLLFPDSEASPASSTVPSNTAVPAAVQVAPVRTAPVRPAPVRPQAPINYRQHLLQAGFTGGRLRKLGMTDADAYQAYRSGRLKP